MPVKKPKKTNKKKMLKRDIKKAVEKLPGLIVEQVRLSKPAPQTERPAIEPTPELTKKNESEKPKSSRNAHSFHDQRKAKWLWTGVISFCLVIFGLWGWNMYMMIGDATRTTNGPTTWIPNPITNDLRTVWEEVGAADDEQDGTNTIKEKIRANIKGLLTQVKSLPNAVATSTTPTTTAESVTVSL